MSSMATPAAGPASSHYQLAPCSRNSTWVSGGFLRHDPAPAYHSVAAGRVSSSCPR